MGWRVVSSLSAIFAIVGSPAMAGDAERGKQVFQVCMACHGDKPGDLGPSLVGVVGRKAGALDDFRYSGPMTRAGWVWDEARLRAFVLDPQDVIKGTKMPFDGLASDRDAEDVVAYLASRR
jgi:cytochrome c